MNSKPVRTENLIDAHVHLWTNDFRKYPLAPAFQPADLPLPAYLPEDLLRNAPGACLLRVVLVQAKYYGLDNSYMLDVIRSQPEMFCGIAVVDGSSPDLEAKMDGLAACGVRGFRISDGGPHNNLAHQPGLQRIFRHAAKQGLAICPLINPGALPQLDQLCREFPDTRVVIDHIARIGMGGPVRDSDVKALCGLARHSQTRVKLSAFYTLGNSRPPHLDLAPLIERVHEAFGARRLMWGSDCPFQTQRETYEDSVSLVRDRLTFLSAPDKEWILRRTAEQLFFSG